jgi:lipid-A-disaccharide synthase
MKYYFLAGEASGDLLASGLVRSLKLKDPEFEAKGWGGDLMKEAGVSLSKHIKDLAFMGFAEVLLNLGKILRNFRTCKQEIRDFKPDAVILVDYPGFNMKIAKFTQSLGLKTFFYVSPSVWAWKKSRMFQLRDSCDRLFVILPFEQEFYAKEGIHVDYFGHPLSDQIAAFHDDPKTLSLNLPSEKPVVALLPGSRRQELEHALPIFAQLPERFPDYTFILAEAPGIPKGFYNHFLGECAILRVNRETYALLSIAQYAIVTSGTATLETALFNVPQVVVYKTSPASFMIGKMVVNINFISLVNLILQKACVTELIQDDFNLEKISEELKRLSIPEVNDQIRTDYKLLAEKIGEKGVSIRIAERIIEMCTIS